MGDLTVLEREKIGRTVHLAVFIEVGECMLDSGKYFRNNVGAGPNLLAGAVACGVRKIIFPRTAAVSGIPSRIPIPETAAAAPVSPYGASEVMFEQILRWHHDIRGLKSVVLRYFNAASTINVFGEERDHETHLIPLMLQVALGQRRHIAIRGGDYGE